VKRNPYPDPTDGKYGATAAILESLTTADLKTYIKHLVWNQENRTFSTTNAYRSSGYYAFRSGNWIRQCRDIIASRAAEGEPEN